MMTARQQADAGARLEAALHSAGIVISRGETQGGNLARWQRVDGATILGRLQAATGWRVDIVECTVSDPAQLELVP